MRRDHKKSDVLNAGMLSERFEFTARAIKRLGWLVVPLIAAISCLVLNIQSQLEPWHIYFAGSAVGVTFTSLLWFHVQPQSLRAFMFALDTGLITILMLVFVFVLYDVVLAKENKYYWLYGDYRWLHIIVASMSALSAVYLANNGLKRQANRIRTLFERGNAPSWDVWNVLFRFQGDIAWTPARFTAIGAGIGSVLISANLLGIKSFEEFKIYLVLILAILAFPAAVAAIIMRRLHMAYYFHKYGDLVVHREPLTSS
jgi:hypothetical protein